jgi:hypothetical protein
MGYFKPHYDLQFNKRHMEKIRTLVAANADRINDALDLRAQDLFREHPFLVSPDYVRIIEKLLHREEFQHLLNFQ